MRFCFDFLHACLGWEKDTPHKFAASAMNVLDYRRFESLVTCKVSISKR